MVIKYIFNVKKKFKLLFLIKNQLFVIEETDVENRKIFHLNQVKDNATTFHLDTDKDNSIKFQCVHFNLDKLKIVAKDCR